MVFLLLEWHFTLLKPILTNECSSNDGLFPLLFISAPNWNLTMAFVDFFGLTHIRSNQWRIHESSLFTPSFLSIMRTKLWRKIILPELVSRKELQACILSEWMARVNAKNSSTRRLHLGSQTAFHKQVCYKFAFSGPLLLVRVLRLRPLGFLSLLTRIPVHCWSLSRLSNAEYALGTLRNGVSSSLADLVCGYRQDGHFATCGTALTKSKTDMYGAPGG